MMSSSGILTINLSAIQSNWHYVASTLFNNADCAAVVKANAYGVGVQEVARALHQAGCVHYFVVTLEEALELREFLPVHIAIYVLGGVKEGAEPLFANFHLIPVLYSLDAIFRWLDFCKSRQIAFACALKLDTGMTRLGMSVDDFDGFLNEISGQVLLNPVLFMSHLACADEVHHPLNAVQLARFKEAGEKIKLYFPTIKLSIANSSGTFIGAAYHFDMVRIGAALYGINPQPQLVNPLRSVIHLKLPVLQVRELEEAVSVGYGAVGQAASGTRLAVVAGGYADGINRTLGAYPNGQIEGVNVRTLGRISMDSCVFDISASPIAFPHYVEVINDELGLDSLMAKNKSLGYEVLTSLGQRYMRAYVYSDQSIHD